MSEKNVDVSKYDDPEIIGPPEGREELVKAGFWKKIRRVAGKIPFARDAVAAYFCAIDPDTPLRARMTLMAALAYFVSPVDLIPDIIPFLGFTDDAAVIAAVVAALSTFITEKHYAAADEALGRV